MARHEYPFVPIKATVRKYTYLDITRLLLRDGFIDRYTGNKLVFPAALRLLSALLPNEFPYHRNWKMDQTHPMYWDLYPTIDHIEPAARGGQDSETNWMSVSMLTNSRKSNWTLQELGWEIVPAGHISDWDGLAAWFISYVGKHLTILQEHKHLERWYLAARSEYSKTDLCMFR